MNYKSIKKSAAAISCTCALTMGATAAQAEILQISELYLTSGSLSLQGINSALENVNSSYNLVSGYFGAGISQAPSGQAGTYIDPTAIATATLFGGPENLYTAASNLGGENISPGTSVGGPVPSGTVDTAAGTISVNVSSFFATWNNMDYFNAGSLNNGIASGSWDSLTGAYTMSTVSTDVGGATSGFPHTWVFSGTAVPVPEASTYGMLIAGLGCVGLVVRRRKI